MDPASNKYNTEFSVIMMHGFGENANFWLPIFNNANNEFSTRFVFP